MAKKYELLEDDYINHDERILYRIKSLINFIDGEGFTIPAGVLGGYIENESNLSQKDKSWVYHNAMAYGDTIMKDSTIYAANIKNLNIKNSSIEAATVEDSYIENSTIYNSNIKNSYIKKSSIENVTIVDRRVTGTITMPFKDIFQYQCENRLLTAILTEDDRILYSIGCQENITKEEFLDRIYNDNGGLEKNPHRKEYLRLIPVIETYFKGEKRQ